MLETIRDLMNAECVVPEWLHDVFLGYGSPEAANYKQMPNCDSHLDFYDTFLSMPHVMDSFPQYEVKVQMWVELSQLADLYNIFSALLRTSRSKCPLLSESCDL